MSGEKITLTQWMNNINNGKKPFKWDSNCEKCYVPFIINRALSNDINNVMVIHQLGLLGDIPKKHQYLFLFHSIKKYKRPFEKGFVVSTKKPDDDIVMIQTLFNINKERAEEALNILTEDQLSSTKSRWKILNTRKDITKKCK